MVTLTPTTYAKLKPGNRVAGLTDSFLTVVAVKHLKNNITIVSFTNKTFVERPTDAPVSLVS